VLKRDGLFASRLRIPADCPHDSARENREPDPPTGKGLGKPPASLNGLGIHEAGDTTYSERVCALCYIKYGAGSGNRTRTASLEGWSSTIELCPLAPTTDCIRTLSMPRHIVPEASRASRTAAEAGTPSLFDLSIPHRSTLMQDGLGACANTSFTPLPVLYLKGVGFFSRGWNGGRDARVPSVARAGSASVSLAWCQKHPVRRLREQARPQKTYPFKPSSTHT
jgi:hypothetical protein